MTNKNCNRRGTSRHCFGRESVQSGWGAFQFDRVAGIGFVIRFGSISHLNRVDQHVGTDFRLYLAHCVVKHFKEDGTRLCRLDLGVETPLHHQLSPSSKAMPNWTASINTLGERDDFMTSSAPRSEAPLGSGTLGLRAKSSHPVRVLELGK